MARFQYVIAGIFDLDVDQHDPGPAAVHAIPSLRVGDESSLYLMASDTNALNLQVTIAAGEVLNQLRAAIPGVELGTVRTVVRRDDSLGDSPDEWPYVPHRE